MKKYLHLPLFLVLIITLSACTGGVQTAVPTPTAEPEAAAASEVILFSDYYFEDAVRTCLNLPGGDITAAQTEVITTLDLRNADFAAMDAENGGIKDLSDLKYFPNLTELHLDFNEIRDFSPLAALTNLNMLSFNGVHADDLSPLSSLTNMVNICFDWCYASDKGFIGYPSIDFVKNMQNLEIFEAKGAGITDITPLVGLPKLWSVFLDTNLITDISPLAKIKTLQEFSIRDNPITDYSCLEPYREVFPNLYDEFQPDVDLK